MKKKDPSKRWRKGELGRDDGKFEGRKKEDQFDEMKKKDHVGGKGSNGKEGSI